MKVEETDVLIVGAGPTGMVAAAFLAKYGVKAVTLSKYSGPAHQPRGSFTNQRTIEVLRDLGIEAKIDAVGTPLRDIGHNVMATSFVGEEIVRYQCYGVGDRLADYHQASPCQNYNLPQHIIEPVLLDGALDQGADVRFRHELTVITQDDAGVTATIRHRDSAEEYQIRAKYAIAADGGRSTVANQIGFPFEGEAGLIQMANAWIEVDLTEHAAYRPAGQYIMLQPGGNSWVGSGTFVTVAPWTEWLFTREIDASQGEPDLSDDAIIATVRKLIGDESIEVKVKGTGLWQVNSVLATRYRMGRVFIAGDAAHRHSPSGGLGTNTSIQDAYNLAWKLAFVLQGKAGEELLESYHSERFAVGQQVIDRAKINLGYKTRISEVLGLRKGQSPEEGWDALQSIYADTPDASKWRDDLMEAIRLQDYRSTAHGVDIGQRYASSAVMDDGLPLPATARDAAIYYQPTTHPGAHLPHAWIECGRKKLSTLDLVGQGRFTLICGIGGAAWEDAAATVSATLGIDLPTYKIGLNCVYADVVGEWYKRREIDDFGALLVRPDGHICWRSMSASQTPAADLQAALSAVLSR